MKLRQFQVREFKSVWDSGPVNVDAKVTCLVGKNEAGKTALLQALYRTNPIIPSDAHFDETYDYPKREVEDYRFDVKTGSREEAVVVECLYDLETSDTQVVAKALGAHTLKSAQLRHRTYYGQNNNDFELQIDEQAARVHLAGSSELPDALLTTLKAANNWNDFRAALDNTESTTAVEDLKTLLTKIGNDRLQKYIVEELLWPRAPQFLYFDEYFQLTGCASVNALIQRKNEKRLEGADHPLLGLINLARLELGQLVQTKNTTELKNKLEGASNHLTRRIVRFWSQNKHLAMRFDVRDAKSEDPEGMRDGVNIWGEVYDQIHMASTQLGTRSRGFVWFFSFLAWYEDVKRKQQNVILLLDEPGLSLHGRAQGDLLKYFDTELAARQVMYSTHSPFMIDARRFERVRIVQDSGIDASKELPKAQDGTKVLKNIFEATNDSLFPLQKALGYDSTQTLFIGPNSVVVEGPSDLLYLRAISGELEREGRISLSSKWTITPVGSISKVPAYVALLGAQPGLNIAVLVDIQKRDRPLIEDLYEKKFLKKHKVMTFGDFVNRDEADIEDLFERSFYVELVNREFGRQLREPIAADRLGPRARTLKAVEAHLIKEPLVSGVFGHYRPARYFVEHVADLWKDVGEDTKSRFESIFKVLNGLVEE